MSGFAWKGPGALNAAGRAAPPVREGEEIMDRRALLVGVTVLALAGAADPGDAQVNVSIGINLPAPPSLVIIPGTPVAYAPAVPANVFFYGGEYWVYGRDVWYAGPTYRGPWVVVEAPYIPLPLLTVPVRYFRAPPPTWKAWRRDAPPRWNPAWGHEWHNAHAEYDKEWKKGGKNHPPDHKEWSKQQEKQSKEEDKHAKEMEKEGKGHPK
jgi:hypothetical protein